jgi:hypothetical protein
MAQALLRYVSTAACCFLIIQVTSLLLGVGVGGSSPPHLEDLCIGDIFDLN